MPQQAKGLQGQNNVTAEGSVQDHQHSPRRQSLKALPRALHQLLGARAYKAKVLRWCLPVIPGEVILGFCGEVSLGSEPSFIAFLGVRPLGSFPPPKSDRVGLGTADSPFSPQTMQKPVGYPGNYVSISVCLTITCCPCHRAGWVARVGLSEAGSATLPSSPP